MTKRDLLRAISSIFDPLGMIASIILKARIILQKVRSTGLPWDEPLPECFITKWNKWASRLRNIETLRIPRCLKNRSDVPLSRTLHCFCDASTDGYGTVVHLRTEYPSGSVDVTFVVGKSRVAPVKFVSIHRLELQAALLGSRICASISKPLGLGMECVTFWSDSQTVLRWLNSNTMKFHVFVANRVGDILDTAPAAQWRYVATSDNPADDSSRGLYGCDLSLSHRWFNGPKFLSCPIETWPVNIVMSEPKSGDPEVSGPIAIFSVNVEPSLIVHHPIAMLFERSSSWPKCIRVIARIRRILPQGKHLRNRSSIDVDELTQAESILIKFIQCDAFGPEMQSICSGHDLKPTSSLRCLSPYLDKEGMLRVDGRLGNSPVLPVSSKHPIVLPAKHRGTRLIIRYYHLLLCHASPSRILCDLVQKYWTVHARRAINSVLSECTYCKRRSVTPVPPYMAPLPSTRLKPSDPPFAVTGVDYFGPMEVIIFRRKVKRYGVIFTCLATRAVHLEVASSLDADSFIMAFRRFTNVRGRVAICYSDNGTNLAAGEKELRSCLQQWNQQHLTDSLAQTGVKWVFNPPAAPHFGGVWERLIRSAKSALNIILHLRSFTDETLATAMS